MPTPYEITLERRVRELEDREVRLEERLLSLESLHLRRKPVESDSLNGGCVVISPGRPGPASFGGDIIFRMPELSEEDRPRAGRILLEDEASGHVCVLDFEKGAIRPLAPDERPPIDKLKQEKT